LHGRTSLLRLQSDERLIALLRRGNMAAFEVLLARYESRLMAFCRHLLGSREDAEDVLQEVMTAAFNAILADDRPINVRPWLYRIARNRSLNHLRRIQAIGVDSMDHHLSEHGATTADKVHEREEFRLLVGDIHELPETQKTALVLREMDALSYDQIAEAMETTVPSVKSLLVRARVSLAEASEARLLSCDEVRIELAEVAEGLQRRPGPLVRRHLRSCKRCSAFRTQLKQTNKALAALLPVGPLAMLHKLVFLHLGHSAGAGSSGAGAASAAGAGAGAAGAGAGVAGGGVAGGGAVGAGAGAGLGAVGAGGTALAGGGVLAGSSGLISAGFGAFAGKAAAGLAAAALVTAGAVESGHTRHHVIHHATAVAAVPAAAGGSTQQAAVAPSSPSYAEPRSSVGERGRGGAASRRSKRTKVTKAVKTTPATTTPTATSPTPATTTPAAPAKAPAAGRTQTQSDPTVLPSAPPPAPVATAAPAPTPAPATTAPVAATTPTSTISTGTGTGTGTGTTTDPTGTTTDPTGTSTQPTGTTTDPTGTSTDPTGTTTEPTGTNTTGTGTTTTPTGTGATTTPTGTANSGTGTTTTPTPQGTAGGPAQTAGAPSPQAVIGRVRLSAHTHLVRWGQRHVAFGAW
jgi:RNA polymerase sigma factor (sigma-70 family)